MTIQKTKALVGFSLLLAGITPQVWSADLKDTASAPTVQVASTESGASLLGIAAPILNASTSHPREKTCQAGALYSQHDVVGDPDNCLAKQASFAVGRAPAVPGF
ncbi:MAG TPA: hypothetical protein VMT61_04535 [Candidatus Binataceae bacterium]|nr:hypothetical protein [Candidatus Binataceae bacterium]